VNDVNFAQEASALSDWLYGAAMPLWLAHGIDWERRAFHESLDPESLLCGVDFRRLYVTARQIYVFAQAEKAGVVRAYEAVTLGLDFLENRARQADGGYAWRFAIDNAVTNPVRDLYDLAFVLFGFANANRPERCHAAALQLMDFIDRVLKDPFGGWQEADPPRLPRRQNPHMHLLEAALAAYEAFGDSVFLEVADAVAGLAIAHFIDEDKGLCEYFDSRLTPMTDGAGHYVTEPGHHYEWAWLLARYGKLRKVTAEAARRLQSAATSLIRLADRNGLSSAANAAIDEVMSDGTIVSGKAKLWPQTERLKARLAWPGSASAPLSSAVEGLRAYIDGMSPGCWREQRDEDGNFIPQPMQASSLYHLTCAILEAKAHA